MTGKLYTRKECQYGSLPGVHITGLKEMRRSPKHFKHRLEHPREPSAAMELGTATHIAILEPERFLREFALWNATDAETGKTRQRRGAAWDEFCKLNAGRTIIRDEEYEQSIALRDAVRADPLAMKYLAMGRPEIAMTWTDSHTGVECVGRLDWDTRVDKHPAIVDVKTTRNAGEFWFSRDVARLDYHLQLAYYSDGYEAAIGKAPRVVVIAVESAPPHDVVTYIVPDDVLDIGRVAYRELLEKYKACADAGEWPGQQGGEEEKYLALPAWAVPEEENDDMGDLDWSKSA